ncbi:9912_t:CDS:2 [Entrophospora sp. SA101]|nr:9912_t:CDS:2 [Entrophospora sp. SA101]
MSLQELRETENNCQGQQKTKLSIPTISILKGLDPTHSTIRSDECFENVTLQ